MALSSVLGTKGSRVVMDYLADRPSAIECLNNSVPMSIMEAEVYSTTPPETLKDVRTVSSPVLPW